MKKVYQAKNDPFCFKSEGLKPSALIEVVVRLLSNGWCQYGTSIDADGLPSIIHEGVKFDLYGAFMRVKLMLSDTKDQQNMYVTFEFVKRTIEQYSEIVYGRCYSMAELNDREDMTKEELIKFLTNTSDFLKGYNL